MTVDPGRALDSLSVGGRITPPDLTTVVSQLLTAAGMEDQSANQAAELMVWAQRSGINSHGVMPAILRASSSRRDHQRAALPQIR